MDAYCRWKRAEEEIGHKVQARTNFLHNADLKIKKLHKEYDRRRDAIRRDADTAFDQMRGGQLWLLSRRLMLLLRQFERVSSEDYR